MRDALKKAKGAKPTVVTLQDPRDGKTHQVVKVDELKAAGVKVNEPKPARGYGESEEDRKKREAAHAKAVEKARAEIEGRFDLLTRVRAAAAAAPRSAFDLQMVAQVACAGVGWKDKETLAELYGLERSALDGHIATLPLDALTLFILDCALVRDVRVESYALDRKPEQLLAAAAHYGVAMPEKASGGEATGNPSKRRPGAKTPPPTIEPSIAATKSGHPDADPAPKNDGAATCVEHAEEAHAD